MPPREPAERTETEEAIANLRTELDRERRSVMMDWLKTEAPFWKLEDTDTGGVWVEARDSDDQAAARWAQKPGDAA